jgi:hypothetical protein
MGSGKWDEQGDAPVATPLVRYAEENPTLTAVALFHDGKVYAISLPMQALTPDLASAWLRRTCQKIVR